MRWFYMNLRFTGKTSPIRLSEQCKRRKTAHGRIIALWQESVLLSRRRNLLRRARWYTNSVLHSHYYALLSIFLLLAIKQEIWSLWCQIQHAPLKQGCVVDHLGTMWVHPNLIFLRDDLLTSHIKCIDWSIHPILSKLQGGSKKRMYKGSAVWSMWPIESSRELVLPVIVVIHIVFRTHGSHSTNHLLSVVEQWSMQNLLDRVQGLYFKSTCFV